MIHGSILRPVRQADVQVILFIIPELPDNGDQVSVQAGVVLHHLLDLVIIMLGHQVLNSHIFCQRV